MKPILRILLLTITLAALSLALYKYHQYRTFRTQQAEGASLWIENAIQATSASTDPNYKSFMLPGLLKAQSILSQKPYPDLPLPIPLSAELRSLDGNTALIFLFALEYDFHTKGIFIDSPNAPRETYEIYPVWSDAVRQFEAHALIRCRFITLKLEKNLPHRYLDPELNLHVESDFLTHPHSLGLYTDSAATTTSTPLYIRPTLLTSAAPTPPPAH